jgi:hypothetical protein
MARAPFTGAHCVTPEGIAMNPSNCAELFEHLAIGDIQYDADTAFIAT